MPHKILLEQLRKGISAIVLLCLTVLAEARQPLFVLDRAAGLSDSRIACMLLSADGRIWIGTGTGINMFNGNNCSSVYAGNGLPSNNILSLCQVADGTVWAGTDAGIGLLDADGRPAGKAIVLPPQIGLAAMDILCADNQNVWVRGASGVARYSHAGKLLQVLADGSGLVSAKVTCMAIDDNANLWIGTADAGIEFYSTRQNKFLHYGTQLAGAHGEISAHVSGLRFDKNGTL